MRLYVDGALVTESTLRYPRTLEPYTVSYIASNVRMEVRSISSRTTDLITASGSLEDPTEIAAHGHARDLLLDQECDRIEQRCGDFPSRSELPLAAGDSAAGA